MQYIIMNKTRTQGEPCRGAFHLIICVTALLQELKKGIYFLLVQMKEASLRTNGEMTKVEGDN